jgi:hypothetical protein
MSQPPSARNTAFTMGREEMEKRGILRGAVEVDLSAQRDVLIFPGDNILISGSQLLSSEQQGKLEELLVAGACYYIQQDGGLAAFKRQQEIQRLLNIETLPFNEQLALYQRAGIARTDILAASECDPTLRAELEKAFNQGRPVPGGHVFLTSMNAAQSLAQYCATVMGGPGEKVTLSSVKKE